MGTFEARCDSCRKVQRFEEGKEERRRIVSREGDFEWEVSFFFRCSTCGRKYEKIRGTDGLIHRWRGDKHVTLKGGD